jgi:DNA-binding response OmpR family regulator
MVDETALSGLTVLIIEDEFLIAADVQRIVEDAGAARTLLAGTTAAVRGFLAGELPIDIAILDLKLGAEDGLPLAQELRAARIPFVIVTGMDETDGLPDVVVVQKPFGDGQVVEALVKARSCQK